MRKKSRKAAAIAGLDAISDRSAVVPFLVFLIVAIFIFDSLGDQQALADGAKTITAKQPQETLSKELADSLVSKLTISSKEQDGVAFIVKDTVDPELLSRVASMDYEQVKATLGIKTDFVIHFEDEQGRIVPIGDKLCLGSRHAKINGVACG